VSEWCVVLCFLVMYHVVLCCVCYMVDRVLCVCVCVCCTLYIVCDSFHSQI
jgi:hypothetical protein